MPNLHPFLVHFPIGLLTVSILFELLAKAFRHDELSRAGWWTQLAGSIGVLLAVLTGVLAKSTVNMPLHASEVVNAHQQMAFIIAVLFTLLLLWRIGARTRLPARNEILFLLIFALGVVALWVAASLGGEMVYRFGTGVV